ncbi:MAG: hypothetical protein H6726_03625 [Sandaracinaceae bacterium]|nr:hypothetical protein [Myxococcales bacterium]MCB9656716.1 hypothetical protein [Sandaracinaceae bacterium]
MSGVQYSQSGAPLSTAHLPREPLGFFAARGYVKKTGDYPGKRAVAVMTNGAILGGSLVGLVLVTAIAGYFNKTVGGVLFALGAVAIALLLMPFIDRRLFQMRTALTALSTEVLVRGRDFSTGSATAEAERFVAEKYGSLDGIVDAHNDVQRIVRKFFEAFDKVEEMLPIDVGPVRRAFDWLVRQVSPRVADLCLSHCLARGLPDIREGSKDAVALVAQNPRAILGTAIRANLTERMFGGFANFVTTGVIGGAAFAIIQAVAGRAAADAGVPSEGATVMGLFAAGFGALLIGLPFGALTSWFIRTAFLEPASLVMLLSRFHQVTANQAVDPQMRKRIEQAASSSGSSGGLGSLFD